MGVIGTRIVRLAITLLAVSFASFYLINLLPGDPAVEIVGVQFATDENLARVRAELGLEGPVHERYWHWLGDAVHGDLGNSYRSRQPVSDEIGARLPVSLELILLAQALSIIAALIVVPLAATRAGGLLDRGLSAFVAAALAVPPFTVGLVLIFVFAVRFQAFPATGFVPLGDSIVDNLRSVALPTLALALVPFAVYVQSLRTELVRVLDEDYIAFAEARGLSQRYVLFRHALRPASLPLLTLIGINMGALVGAAMVIETMFSLPGVGRLGIDAIRHHDYVMAQGVVAFVTLFYVLFNFLVDVLYAVLDPRVRIRHD